MPTSAQRPCRPSDFVVGFEFEFVSKLLDRKYGSSSALSNRRVRLPFGTLGEDGDSYELRTRPSSGVSAPEVLMSCIQFMDSVSARTRPEDGLHINVSLSKKSLHLSVNPICVWVLAEPHRWALKFGRSRAWACLLPRNLVPSEILDFLSSTSPRRPAINFSHFRPHEAPSKSRIEFRYPGEKNYHRRIPLLMGCLESVLSSVAGSVITSPRIPRIALSGVSSAHNHALWKTAEERIKNNRRY